MRFPATATRQRGLTLVELMVSMALGMLLIAGAVSLTLANRRSFDTNQGMSQVQESARSAFELLARDVRQAGPSGCGNADRVTANLVAGTLWWQTPFWIRGFDETVAGVAPIGTALNERVTGTDAIWTQSMQGQGFSIALHDTTLATIQLSTTTDFVIGDVLVACDGDHTTIFRASSYTAATNTIGIATGILAAPANCSPGLGFPTVCSSPGAVYQFPRNSLVARLSATEWYIGRNGRTTETGMSLFRRRLTSPPNAATPPVVVVEEIIADVVDMNVMYRVGTNDDYFNATAITTAADWARVTAVRIELWVDSADTRVSTDPTANSGRITRRFTQVIALRNRMP